MKGRWSDGEKERLKEKKIYNGGRGEDSDRYSKARGKQRENRGERRGGGAQPHGIQ